MRKEIIGFPSGEGDKKPRIFDEEGKVQDVEVAKRMAQIEDEGHERRLGGLLPPDREMIKIKEQDAVRWIMEEKGEEISREDLPDEVKNKFEEFERSHTSEFIEKIKLNEVVKSAKLTRIYRDGDDKNVCRIKKKIVSLWPNLYRKRRSSSGRKN